MTVFNPFDIHRYAVSRKSDSDNNYSLTIKASFPKTSFLFTGDIETEAENSMLQFGDKLASTVLKVAHHGSRTSSEKIFLDYVSPVAAVISVSEINLFGHPSSEVLERLSGVTTTDSDVTNPNSGVAIYRTDKDGAVSFSDTPEGLRVRTYRSWDTSFNRRSWDDTHSSATTHIEIENIKRLFTVW
jgi:competence protein ComEC